MSRLFYRRKGEENGPLKWDWKLVGQWVVIVGACASWIIMQDRRVTTLEAALGQEMKGYQSVFVEVNRRIELMESRMNDRFTKLDERLDRIRERRP